MPADLVIDAQGQAAMVYAKSGGTPWHGLGVALNDDERYDFDAAMKRGGMDFEVELVPLCTHVKDEKPVAVSAKAVRRKDTKQILCNHVGVQYHVLQPQESFDLYKPFVANKLVSLETAGLLAGGKKIFVQAEITGAKPLDLGHGDLIRRYLLLSNSYDGTTSVRFGLTPQRVVCSNTLAMAIHNKRSQLIRVRHTKSIKQSLEDLRDTINLANQAFEATFEQYQKLVNKTINQKDLAKYMRLALNIKSEKLNGQQQQMLESCFRLFESGKGSNLPTAKGTWFGAYQAVNEFFNWERGKNQDTRLTSLWFGASAKDDQEALALALQMSA